MEKKSPAHVKIIEAQEVRLYNRMQHIYESRLNLDTRAKMRTFRRQALEVEHLYENFERVFEESIRLQVEADPDLMPDYDPLDRFEEMYYELKDLIRVMERDPSPEVTMGKPQLAKMELMEFDGDPWKWPLFFETFKQQVHDDPALEPIHKLHYLLGQLKGQALADCTGILPTAANYPVIWGELVRKYEDKRALAKLYLGQILEFKPLTKESVEGVNQFSQKIDTAVRSLRQLQVANLGDFILTSICLSKLDAATRVLFERSLERDEFPTFDKLTEFIKDQCRILSRSADDFGKLGPRVGKSHPFKSFTVSETTSKKDVSKSGCEMCQSGSHRIYKCPKFLALSQKERKRLVFKKSLCFNCLGVGHSRGECPSTYSCGHCRQNHHTLLHASEEKPSTERGAQQESSAVALVSTAKEPRVKQTVLLSTATVWVTSRRGERILMRVLLDSASQCNFITNSFCRRLRLPVKPVATSVSGIGSGVKPVKGRVAFNFTSRVQPSDYRLEAWVIDRITDNLPSVEVDTRIHELLADQQLADEAFASPGPIDGMIGAELVPMFLGKGKPLGPGWPMVMDSPLGVIVMGKAPIQGDIDENQVFCCTKLDEMVQKFWELENVAESQAKDPDDVTCERLFANSVQRGEDGRYTVALPFHEFLPSLGDSYGMARRRFLSLERKFSRNLEFATKYGEVMQDYLDQGHMQLVKPGSERQGYYIPHHGILKTSSTSTPLRVVFDASASSDNGRSLNETMFVGPKLQNELFDLLIRFRTFKIAMTADIKQMYRQIWVRPEHRPFQRLVWRFDRGGPLQEYELTTVTSGVKASPFLALRTVQQLALDEGQRFPEAAERLQRELYMDDVVSSVPDLPGALELHRQWVGLFKAGGFQLTKWATNSAELLKQIPPEARRSGVVDFPTDVLTVLGLCWAPDTDEFIFKVEVQESDWSKRAVLSTMARIWDPLGLLTPVTVLVKLFMKRLWSLSLDWDDPLPPEVLAYWQEFVGELSELGNFRIPRHLGVKVDKGVSLVGFADASEKAYAAVVYVLVEKGDGTWRSQLLCAKSKVAPMKTTSIPRLELCGALLLARLLNSIIKINEGILSFQKISAFSDSTVVLHWLQGAPHRWKTFVANRVVKIHDYLPDVPWLHVRSEDNPADGASRGLSARQFLGSSLWREEPTWLLYNPDRWPVDSPPLEVQVGELEEKPERCLVTTVEEQPLDRIMERCGSWGKLLRVMIQVLRYCRKLPRRESLRASDYAVAEECLVKFVQQRQFSSLIADLQAGRPAEKKFRVLTPFLQDGVIRVGGRLRNSGHSGTLQHPILLPKGGAKRHLDELGNFLASKDLKQGLQKELSEQRIEWKLNPPAAPHFGGSWEAGVKSVKYHLVRVVGDQVLTFKEFSTVLCEIESVLNSRPLCWMSTDPADPVALTPAHFLTLMPLQSLPGSTGSGPANLGRRRELIAGIVRSYWTRWRQEYLTTLQKRMKWNTPACPVQKGELVLIHQDHALPLSWPMGEIQEVYPGADGVIRVALIRTSKGLLKRPVHKLAPLPTQ